MSGMTREEYEEAAGALRELAEGMSPLSGWVHDERDPAFNAGADSDYDAYVNLRALADGLEAVPEQRSVPVDVVRLAAQYTGELAESLVKSGESARGGHVDIFAEHLQQEAETEQVDWTTVLTGHAARELKLQGPEPGA